MEITRSQDEILARFREVDALPENMFGFAQEVLAGAMTLETVKQALPNFDAGSSEAEPPTFPVYTSENIEGACKEYLQFAIGKALDHRGISASRSIDKLTQFAWLVGKDNVVEAMDEADYTNYGVPKLKAFADGMELPFEAGEYYDQSELDNMAAGKPCREDCEEGCV